MTRQSIVQFTKLSLLLRASVAIELTEQGVYSLIALRSAGALAHLVKIAIAHRIKSILNIK